MDVLTSRIGRMTPLLMAVALAVAALACTAADDNGGADVDGAGGTPSASAPSGAGSAGSSGTPGGGVGSSTPGGVDGTPAAGAPPAAGGSSGGSGVVDGDSEYVRRPAPIESAAMHVAESMPPQYFVDIVSGLPSGCATFDDYEVTRDGDTVSIMLWNREPAPESGLACTMVYGFVEHSIALGSDFEAGRTYTVTVNDRSTTFTVQ